MMVEIEIRLNAVTVSAFVDEMKLLKHVCSSSQKKKRLANKIQKKGMDWCIFLPPPH